ncbi:AraC family transcriptional regulator [Cohnella fermenti]|uniref:AraC family transcriptional regulator n=1 Tax=Cohnella fermenti TaxID=2565925 RepID=A0A4S4BJL3_9BACL|nr:AraC family transcriptional regulator [Cohnella fermenti]THF74847.1 AraC family transcriptional regulator [Cohnella fermenti]
MTSSLFPDGWLDGDYRPRVHAYYFKQWSRFAMDFHRHSSTEIMYAMSGTCRVELAPHASGTPHSISPVSIAMKRGDFIILNADIPHRLLVDDKCRMLNVEFNRGDWAGPVPSLRSLSAEDESLRDLLRAAEPYAVLRDPEDVYHILRSLVLELDRQGSSAGAMAQLLLSQLLMRIGRLRSESVGASALPAESYVRQAMDYVHQNYDRDIQVKDVAAAVSLHPGYLQRIFKAQAGRTLGEYLTNLRMQKARMLLRQTDIPVSDISDYVGTGSRQYFHALFKKHTGQTPVEFRAQRDTHRWDIDKT